MPKQVFPPQQPKSQNLVGQDEDIPWMEQDSQTEEGELTIDCYQQDDNVVIKSTVAGVKPDDIDISFADNVITIKGERTKDEEVKEEGYLYQECYWGRFSRSIKLPCDIDNSKIKASLRDGILTVQLPKAAKAKAKSIKVESEQ
ncbi:molecular chaperone [bacterium (Candidatus Torokbacteria) CG_4_10_14_0_2_um_filter_35_8]|nr:MAG: molecular chaperone [bacterium (Candidatus Torokbacteria) CG_4_10_14_0_2_um_filter_35_8]